MERNPEVDRTNGRPQQSSIATEAKASAADKRAGRYVVIDTHSGRQHARGLTQARAEALAREYCDGVVARRERPDPHWIQRGGSA